jgi:hypothetical protein
LPLRLPWEAEEIIFNRNAVASIASEKRDRNGQRNRVAVAESIVRFSQGSRSGNPGLEVATALRLKKPALHSELKINERKRA